MKGFIFLIIVAVIIRNFKSQQKRVQKPQGGTQMSKPAGDQPAVPPTQSSSGRLPRPFSPEMHRTVQSPDAPRDVDSPAQGTSPDRPLPAEPLRDMATECDDGYGSLPHTSHEGDELHTVGAHSDTAVSARYAHKPDDAPTAPESPGQDDTLSELIAADALSVDGEAPMLLGRELDADEMRRAVVLSEILNKRGGHSSWARM